MLGARAWQRPAVHLRRDVVPCGVGMQVCVVVRAVEVVPLWEALFVARTRVCSSTTPGVHVCVAAVWLLCAVCVFEVRSQSRRWGGHGQLCPLPCPRHASSHVAAWTRSPPRGPCWVPRARAPTRTAGWHSRPGYRIRVRRGWVGAAHCVPAGPGVDVRDYIGCCASVYCVFVDVCFLVHVLYPWLRCLQLEGAREPSGNPDFSSPPPSWCPALSKYRGNALPLQSGRRSESTA